MSDQGKPFSAPLTSVLNPALYSQGGFGQLPKPGRKKNLIDDAILGGIFGPGDDPGVPGFSDIKSGFRKKPPVIEPSPLLQDQGSPPADPIYRDKDDDSGPLFAVLADDFAGLRKATGTALKDPNARIGFTPNETGPVRTADMGSRTDRETRRPRLKKEAKPSALVGKGSFLEGLDLKLRGELTQPDPMELVPAVPMFDVEDRKPEKKASGDRLPFLTEKQYNEMPYYERQAYFRALAFQDEQDKKQEEIDVLQEGRKLQNALTRLKIKAALAPASIDQKMIIDSRKIAQQTAAKFSPTTPTGARLTQAIISRFGSDGSPVYMGSYNMALTAVAPEDRDEFMQQVLALNGITSLSRLVQAGGDAALILPMSDKMYREYQKVLKQDLQTGRRIRGGGPTVRETTKGKRVVGAGFNLAKKTNAKSAGSRLTLDLNTDLKDIDVILGSPTGYVKQDAADGLQRMLERWKVLRATIDEKGEAATDDDYNEFQRHSENVAKFVSANNITRVLTDQEEAARARMDRANRQKSKDTLASEITRIDDVKIPAAERAVNTAIKNRRSVLEGQLNTAKRTASKALATLKSKTTNSSDFEKYIADSDYIPNRLGAVKNMSPEARVNNRLYKRFLEGASAYKDSKASINKAVSDAEEALEEFNKNPTGPKIREANDALQQLLDTKASKQKALNVFEQKPEAGSGQGGFFDNVPPTTDAPPTTGMVNPADPVMERIRNVRDGIESTPGISRSTKQARFARFLAREYPELLKDVDPKITKRLVS